MYFFYRVLFPDIQYETFLYLCVHLNVSLAKKKKQEKKCIVFLDMMALCNNEFVISFLFFLFLSVSFFPFFSLFYANETMVCQRFFGAAALTKVGNGTNLPGIRERHIH